MLRVWEINDLDELQPLQADWQRLCSLTRGATFLHSFPWFSTYWRHFGHEQRLRVLLVANHEELQGIVPLVVLREPTRVGNLRVLTYPLHDWGTFYSPLGNSPRQTLAAALAKLRRTPRDWDLLDLRWIDETADAGDTLAAMRSAAFSSRMLPWRTGSAIEINGAWEDYWASRNAHFRQNVHRAMRQLSARGEMRYVRFRLESGAGDIDPRWDLFDECVALAGRSWQGDATDGTTLNHDAVRHFLRDAHAAAVACGAVDLNLLYLNGVPAAFAYNYFHAGRVEGLRTGFDPAVATQGAGHVLFARMLEDSFRRGDRFFDLGVGYLPSKRHWQTTSTTSMHCPHYAAASPRAQLLRLKSWLLGRRVVRVSDAKSHKT